MPDLRALIPQDMSSGGSGIARSLAHPGGGGFLTLMTGQHDGTGWKARSFRRLGPAQQLSWKSWYALSICLEGHGWLQGQRGAREVRAGSMLRFSGRRDNDIWQRVERIYELVLSVDGATGDALAALGFWPPGDEVTHGCVTEELVKAFLRLRRDAESTATSAAELNRRLIDLLMLAWSTMDTAGDAGFAAEARRLLADDLPVGPSVAATARRLGLSERQFRRRFQRAAGTSPHEYRRHLRMEKACQLLADLPVAAVASRLGYADASVFSRQFSAAMGMPPSSLRRGAPGGPQPRRSR